MSTSEHNKSITNWAVIHRTEHLISRPLGTVNIVSNVPVHWGDAAIPRRGNWQGIQPSVAAGGVISIHAPIMTFQRVWGAGPGQDDKG